MSRKVILRAASPAVLENGLALAAMGFFGVGRLRMDAKQLVEAFRPPRRNFAGGSGGGCLGDKSW